MKSTLKGVSSKMHDENSAKNSLKISQKEAGHVVALFIVIGFFLFVAGYFLGKKKMLEEISEQHDRSFIEKVQNSFDTFVEPDTSLEESSEDSVMEDVPSDQVLSSKEVSLSAQESIKKTGSCAAYAQLCGFGTKRAAQKYHEKLRQQGYDVQVIDKTSRTKKGKIITWYQVITDVMDKNELMSLVEKIKKDDKLTGVKVIDIQTYEA